MKLFTLIHKIVLLVCCSVIFGIFGWDLVTLGYRYPGSTPIPRHTVIVLLLEALSAGMASVMAGATAALWSDDRRLRRQARERAQEAQEMI